MYASLRRQGRLHHPLTGKIVTINPISGGRDTPPASDPKELAAIDRAIALGEPLYFCQHANGTIYDVLTNKTAAINFCDATRARTPSGNLNVLLFEQKGSNLVRIH